MRSFVGLASVLAVVACRGETARAPDLPTSPPGGRVLAAVYAKTGQVAELDARTLRTLRAADVGFPPTAVAKSPDGSAFAVGSGNAPRVRLVDRLRMRAGAEIELPGPPGHVEAIAWPAERRVVAFVAHMEPRVVVVDPEARRVVAVHELDGAPVAWQTTARGVVLLVAPRRRIGPARLVVVGADGYRSTPLDGIRAGWKTEKIVPGLAADPAGRRAVVVPPGHRVAEIDLDTLAVRHHELTRPVSLLGRLREWLEPSAHAKSIDGPERTAVWAGRDHVAVAGTHVDGGQLHATGAHLIDTRGWTVRPLASDASAVTASAGTVLVYGGSGRWTESGREFTGLRGFDAAGRERFRAFGGRHVASVAVAGRYAYLENNGATWFRVVDVYSGRVRVARTRWTTVILGRA